MGIENYKTHEYSGDTTIDKITEVDEMAVSFQAKYYNYINLIASKYIKDPYDYNLELCGYYNEFVNAGYNVDWNTMEEDLKNEITSRLRNQVEQPLVSDVTKTTSDAIPDEPVEVSNGVSQNDEYKYMADKLEACFGSDYDEGSSIRSQR